MHEIHVTVIVVIVVGALGCIHRELQVVWPDSVPLGVTVSEDASLEELVV